jgi:hypothetical protein
MSSLRDHLQTLGLTEDASLDDALASYKDLVRVWHPDRFGHDARLRRKAEEQTSRINVAMAQVREFFKNPSAYRREGAHQTPYQWAPTSAPPITPALGMALAVHQRRAISLARIAFGLLLIQLGWWMAIVHPGTAGQIALGVAMCGYGFSSALLALTILCFRRPVISVANASIRILGRPSIRIDEIAASHVVVTTKGSIFTLQASPRYIKRTPIPLRLWLHTHLLARRTHYEVRATSLDTHPATIIDTLDIITAQGVGPSPAPTPSPTTWGYYASAFSIVTLAFPVIRLFMKGPLPPTDILPYLVIFAILQTSSVIKTVVLAPTR